MKWCVEHRKWEYPNVENDLHVAVPKSAPEYMAFIKSLCAQMPWNGGTAVCADCGNPAQIVTDGLITEFFCRPHWDWRSQEQDYLDQMGRELHDPLTEEEKETFGIVDAARGEELRAAHSVNLDYDPDRPLTPEEKETFGIE